MKTDRIRTLPVLVLMPHSRCNCRCVMCDIWKANANGREISSEQLAGQVDAMRRLGVRWVTLSGGEALMHSNVWALCRQLRALPARISLLSSGLLLQRHANDVVRWCDDVIVSLDGSREVHDAIRNVPRAFDRLVDGVGALKAARPGFRVTARSVVQRRNYFDLHGIVGAAHAMGLDQVSFLAADVSSDAFNRVTPWDDERAADVALSRPEAVEFERLLEAFLASHAADFTSGYIAETPANLRRLARYYAALNGDGDFPPTRCNAPWVSTVVESDGTVRPCFFHRPLGNIDQQPLDAILNSPESIAFRSRLNVQEDPVCRACVCTLNLTSGPSRLLASLKTRLMMRKRGLHLVVAAALLTSLMLVSCSPPTPQETSRQEELGR